MTYSRRAFLGSSLPAALLADGRAEGRKVVVAAELQPAAAAGVKAVQAGGNAMDAAAAAPSRIAVVIRPLASAAVEGTTTLRPAVCT